MPATPRIAAIAADYAMPFSMSRDLRWLRHAAAIALRHTPLIRRQPPLIALR